MRMLARKCFLGVFLISLAASALAAGSAKPAMTVAEAKKLLADNGEPETPAGLLGILETTRPHLVELVKAYLAIGVRADQPIEYENSEGKKLSAYPLNFLLNFSCRDPLTTEVAKILLDAGADPSLRNPDDNNRTPAIATVGCLDILKLILEKKPDLTLTDNQGETVMHHAILFADDRDTAVRMLLDAGFDPKPKMKEYMEDARQFPEIQAMLQGKRSPAAPAAPSPSANTADWKSLGPFPSYSRAEAAKLLHKPGAATSVDDQLWDAILSHEPLRLAVALEAGANVHQQRAVTGYTPLVLMAERCDMERDPQQQASIAAQLIAAGADLNGTDSNGATPLTMAAGSCPLGVVQALIKSGISLTSASKVGDTPLKRAIMANRVDVVGALLDAGVDPKKEPYNARALASDNKEIQALLKKKRN